MLLVCFLTPSPSRYKHFLTQCQLIEALPFLNSAFCSRFVVCTATMYAQQLTLPFAGQFTVLFIQEQAFLY